MRAELFDYDLPEELIAQAPTAERGQSRLMVLPRHSGEVIHTQFGELIRFLKAGDVLVLNNSKVIPARLRGFNPTTGTQFEVLLLEERGLNEWQVMMRPGKRARRQTQIVLKDNLGRPSAIQATVVGKNQEGHRILQFKNTPNLLNSLEVLGEVPLPPYIRRQPGGCLDEDRQRYQTVYAEHDGSVAAPTAGLHFSKALLERIRQMGVEIQTVTLHVGLGTFAPVKTEDLSRHVMHRERYSVSREAASAINLAKQEGRRVIAVGTTSMRVLESVAAASQGGISPGSGSTQLFVHPPYRFQIVDALLTNFHLPRSTLLMLISAFAAPGETRGREQILSAYQEAVRQRYRFFSYGDAMLIY